MAKGKSDKRNAVDKVLHTMKRRENSALTTVDAALRLSINPAILRRHLRLGNVKSFKIGNQFRITESEIERIMLVGLPALNFEKPE